MGERPLKAESALYWIHEMRPDIARAKVQLLLPLKYAASRLQQCRSLDI